MKGEKRHATKDNNDATKSVNKILLSQGSQHTC